MSLFDYLSLFLGIVWFIGVVFTIYFWIKQFQYPWWATLYKERGVFLFDDIANNLNSINIDYNGKEIDSNIYWFSWILVNDWKIDVDGNEEFIFKLNAESEWLEFNIRKKSLKVYPEAKITSKNNACVWIEKGIFRCWEFIKLEALIKIWWKDDIRNILSVDQRIANTKKIQIKDISEVYSKDWRKSSITIICILFCMLLLAVLQLANSSPKTRWLFVEEDGKEVILTKDIVLEKEWLVKLDWIKGNENEEKTKYSKKVKVEEFLDKKWLKVISWKKDVYEKVLEVFIVIIVILPYILYFAWKYFKFSKWERIIEEIDNVYL